VASRAPARALTKVAHARRVLLLRVRVLLRLLLEGLHALHQV
jgi:hypothetical protein